MNIIIFAMLMTNPWCFVKACIVVDMDGFCCLCNV